MNQTTLNIYLIYVDMNKDALVNLPARPPRVDVKQAYTKAKQK